MSDLHGCYDEFMEMLEQINFSEKDDLYIIGDVIDRGPKPIELLQYIIAHQNNIHLLMGNHESMMFDCLVPPYYTYEEKEDLKYSPNLISNRNLWIEYNGGELTAKEYNKLTYKEQRDIYYFLKELKPYEIIEVGKQNFILVHANPTRGFWDLVNNNQSSWDLLWERISESDLDSDLVPGYEIVVGHTPTVNYGEEYAGKIIERENKYLVDCGCVFGYMLGCLCLDNLEEYYIKKKDTN